MPKQVHEDKMLIFRCNRETINRIKIIAAVEGRNVSSQIRHMIEEYKLKPRHYKAGMAVLEGNPHAKPSQIIEAALSDQYHAEAEAPHLPPVVPSQPVQWWNVPNQERDETPV